MAGRRSVGLRLRFGRSVGAVVRAQEVQRGGKGDHESREDSEFEHEIVELLAGEVLAL